MDVGVLMDESGSVSSEDFEREKNFVNNIAGHFRIGRDAAQFGIISYSDGATLDIKLNEFSDLSHLQYAISTIPQQGIKIMIILCRHFFCQFRDILAHISVNILKNSQLPIIG